MSMQLNEPSQEVLLPCLRVAVAIITDEQQRILITRRSMDSSHGGMWEFPGGKLEKDELASAALVREVKEEVGLNAIGYDYLGEIRHTYKVQPISLLVYHIHHFNGEATRCEAQMDMRWEPLDNLKQFDFPAANIQIIELIKKSKLNALDILAD